MTAVLWEIAAVLDEQRTPAVVENAVWLEVPARRLRGPGSRDDNFWLQECLERLTGLQITGDYRGSPWGAVMIAEWHLERGSNTARILVPPGAIQALRAPDTFAKVETAAAHRMSGPARRLYLALADKKRLRKAEWEYSLDELRAVFAVEGKYPAWRDLARRVIHPAIRAINAYGTVCVRMTPIKSGRRITVVRFSWEWKSLDEARIAAEESDRHSAVCRPDRRS